ncbi:MAG: DUF493 family protein [Lentisphaeria bacterium]|nr:DUF493 family protein [Lentisphaeria bacterium]
MSQSDCGVSQPELVFPLEWRGRIITHARRDDVVDEIRSFLRAFGASAPPVRGNVSSRGTYVTYLVEMTMRDRAMLTQVTHGLAALPGVKTVL